MSAADRSLRARIAVEASWGRTPDPAARTAPARRAFLNRFLDETDPALPMSERLRQAEHKRRAYFLSLARKSAAARTSRKQGVS